MGLTVPDNVVQNLWNYFGERVRKGLEMWTEQYSKWSLLCNYGEESEGQIADRKADTKLCYKVKMGMRTLRNQPTGHMNDNLAKNLCIFSLFPDSVWG
jgi:hypothetical protein